MYLFSTTLRRENYLYGFKLVSILDSKWEERGGSVPFPSGRLLGQIRLHDTKKPVQSLCSESIINQVSVSFAFFFWNLLLRNPGSLQRPAFLSIAMLIPLWLFLLRNFIGNRSVSKPMSKEWPKYLFQILLNRRTARFVIVVALEAPAFPPLSWAPAVTPAAEVSAGVCARPEPCWGLAASALTWSQSLPPDSSPVRPRMRRAQLDSRQSISFGLKEAFGDFFLPAAYHLRILIPG